MSDAFCPTWDETSELPGWCPTPKSHWSKKPLNGLLGDISQWPGDAAVVCLVADDVAAVVPAVRQAEKTLEQKFYEQADKWQRETQHLSSPTQKMMHPSYQAILGMGNEHPREIVSLMIRDMQKHRRPWFWALGYFAQDNPVSQSDAGRTDKMIKAWVDWGKAHQLP